MLTDAGLRAVCPWSASASHVGKISIHIEKLVTLEFQIGTYVLIELMYLIPFPIFKSVF